MSGRYFGSCERSASIWHTKSASVASARRKPSRYDTPSPRWPVRCTTATRPGYVAASASATAPVPSGDWSSSTITEVPSMAIRSFTSTGRFSRSL